MNLATRVESAKRRWTAWAIAAAVATLLPLQAYAEEASNVEDVARAEVLAADAFAAYTSKDYDSAIVLYLKSLEAAPSATVLFNLARIYDTKVSDRELAMNYYRRYIADPGAEPDRVRTANERLRALRELDMLATQAPTAQRADARDRQASAPAEERGLSRLQIAGLVTGLTGVAGLALGTGFGIAAKADADVAKDVCNGNDCTSQRGVDAAHDANDAARIATASFVAGGALALVGVALFVWGRRRSTRPDSPSAQFTPALGATALGGQFSGKW